jgi:carboxylesterase
MRSVERLESLARTLASRYAMLDVGTHGGLVGAGDPSAISIDGDPGRPTVLAFHGFAGSPKEVRIVAETAKKLGFAARAPKLPGHTDNVRDLMDVGWPDWTESARRLLHEVSGPGKPRAMVTGLSLGALVAAHLAATEPERVAGLVVLANAAWLRFSSFRLPLWICEHLEPFDNRFYMRKFGADIRDDAARRAHRTYEVNPIRSAIEVLRGGRVVRAELDRVRCPTLVVHGQQDRVCAVDNAWRFAEKLGTGDVEVRIMPHSGHIVTVDADRSQVALVLESFLRRLSHV